MQNLVYEWVDFFKIWPNLSQNCSKFSSKLGRLVYEWVTFSWKTGICLWVYFQIPWRHIPTKTKLEYPSPPRDLDMEINEEVVTRYFPKNIINHKFV